MAKGCSWCRRWWGHCYTLLRLFRHRSRYRWPGTRPVPLLGDAVACSPMKPMVVCPARAPLGLLRRLKLLQQPIDHQQHELPARHLPDARHGDTAEPRGVPVTATPRSRAACLLAKKMVCALVMVASTRKHRTLCHHLQPCSLDVRISAVCWFVCGARTRRAAVNIVHTVQLPTSCCAHGAAVHMVHNHATGCGPQQTHLFFDVSYASVEHMDGVRTVHTHASLPGHKSGDGFTLALAAVGQEVHNGVVVPRCAHRASLSVQLLLPRPTCSARHEGRAWHTPC